MDKLRNLLSMKKSKIETEFSPYFYQYFKNTLFESQRGFDDYLTFVKYYFERSEAGGKKVLDVGCGFGLISIIFSFLGAKSVDAIDINSEDIRIMDKILRKLDLKNIKTKKVDGTKIPFPDNSFDVVLAIEVVSHAYNLDVFLSEIKRVLKPGGMLYVHDGNNLLNIPDFWKRRKIQKIAEFEGSKEIGVSIPYIKLREDMIKKEFPEISQEKLKFLSHETKGLWGEEIYSAVKSYIKKGSIENDHKSNFRNPITGEFSERPFNPYSLASKLRNFGFSNTQVSPFLPISPKRKLIRKLIISLYPLIFLLSGIFEIKASIPD